MINFKYPIEYQSETKEINETIKRFRISKNY